MDVDGCDINRPIFLMKNIFDSSTIAEFESRIAQINLHEYVFNERQDAPPLFMRWMLHLFFKTSMVYDVPYKPNTPTAPMFIKKEQYDIAAEKNRLIAYLRKVGELGEASFEGKKQISLGVLTAKEWNGLLFKHLDHHLRQFGA
jgi:hypothetical protein